MNSANDEARMTNDEIMTKPEFRGAIVSFVIRHSLIVSAFVIRHSSS
jgi:hypothetical protein